MRWDNGAATGNWNAKDANWSGKTWDHSNPDTAVFAKPGGGEIQVNGSVQVQDIRFDADGYHLTGGALTVSTSGDTFITARQNAIISSMILGGILRKAGPATLSLRSANQHGGGTVIEEGTLEVTSLADNGGNLGTSWLSMDRDATLRYLGRGSESTHRDIWINNLSGTRTFDLVNPEASLTLTGANGEISRPIRKTGAGALALDRIISGDASVTVDGGMLTLALIEAATLVNRFP